jgi:ankyrin repeat protein
MVELGLYKSEQDVVNQSLANGATSLHIAVSCCHKDVLELLLEKGGDVSAKTTSGATALIAACTYGDGKTDGGSVEMV